MFRRASGDGRIEDQVGLFPPPLPTHTNTILSQESPPAWTQGAHRPPCSKCSLCCSVYWGGGGLPHPALVEGTLGTPPPSRSGQGVPWVPPHHPDLGWGTPQTLDAVPPTQTWVGVPLHPLRPEMGYPTPRTGMGYPPPPHPQTWDGVPPLPARVDRLKILPSPPHPSDAGGKNSNFHKSPPGICSIYKVNISPDGTSVGKL